MLNHTWMPWGGPLAGLAVGLLTISTALAFEPPDGPVWPMQGQIPGEPLKVSEYWVGLECYPVQEALRIHLKLPEGQGLAVASVVPEGPAAKAGLQPHDILLKASDKPLGKVQDLIDAVDTAKHETMKIELLRRGEPVTVEVAPVKRPASHQAGPASPSSDWEQMRKWLERMRPGEDGRPPFRFRFFHPGTILPPGAAVQPPLPEGMSIVIRKQGKQPAEIVVTQGDQKWELNENELDQLPADVRPYVNRMLGRSSQELGGRFQFFDFVPEWAPPVAAPEMGEKPSPSEEKVFEMPSEGRMEKRLESLERRLEQMRKSLDELRENRPRLRDRQEREKPAAETSEKI